MMENNIDWNKIDADNPRWYELRETLLSKIRNKKDNGTRLNQNIVGTFRYVLFELYLIC